MKDNDEEKNKIKRHSIEEQESVSINLLSEFVNIALATSRINTLKIEQENQIKEIRPSMNLFIFGRIGSTKSTLLGEISEKTNSPEPFSSITYPSLIGSVDSKTLKVMKGACWNCRKSLLLLDEFDFSDRSQNTKNTIKALLQLTEGGKYQRKIASFGQNCKKEDENLYFIFKEGTFTIKTRFSMILVTMKYPYTSQSQDLIALTTRCVCLSWYPSYEIIKEISKGNKIFNQEQKKLSRKEMIIKKEDWEHIINYIEQKVITTNLLRIANDCIRIFAVEQKHRYDLYDYVIISGTKTFQSKKPKINK